LKNRFADPQIVAPPPCALGKRNAEQGLNLTYND
jgi:hypothetical protein